ncbi:PaaI family thioesterase [Paraburkholderia azotifigens]|uniref:PaaI family thioesterase n=1 Tax=Paraburkholderia azotifigens TaxID=2057004 RepID=UPI00317F030E
MHACDSCEQPRLPALHIDSPFCIAHGFELVAYGNGWASIACETVPAHTNRLGNAHGGILAALLDTSMGLATRAGGKLDNLGTASLSVNYLRPARGRLVAQGLMRRSGRTLAFCDAEAHDEEGELVATASAVFAISHKAG